MVKSKTYSAIFRCGDLQCASSGSLQLFISSCFFRAFFGVSSEISRFQRSWSILFWDHNLIHELLSMKNYLRFSPHWSPLLSDYRWSLWNFSGTWSGWRGDAGWIWLIRAMDSQIFFATWEPTLIKHYWLARVHIVSQFAFVYLAEVVEPTCRLFYHYQ